MRIFSALAILLIPLLPIAAQTTPAPSFHVDTAKANALWREVLVLGAYGPDIVLTKLDSAALLYERSLGKESLPFAKVLFGKGAWLFGRAEFDRSEACYREALSIRLRLEDKEHPEVLMCYFALGQVSFEKGEMDKALELFQTFRDLKVKTVGERYAAIATADYSIGNVWHRKADYPKALAYYKKALNTLQALSGPEASELVQPFYALGATYNEMGNFIEAQVYLQRALTVSIKNFGPIDRRVGEVYAQLGNLQASMGDYQAAKETFQKGLAIKEKTYGTDHTEVAMSYTQLGAISELIGDYEQTLQYNQKALSILLRKVGPEHDLVATVYNNSGEACRNMGQFDRAQQFHEAALNIRIHKLGPDHPKTAASYQNLGTVSQEKGDVENALRYYQKTIDILEKTTGGADPDIARCYANSASIFYTRGDYAQARNYIQKALDIRLATMGPAHPEVGESYSNLLEIARAGGQFAAGETWIQQAEQAFRYTGKNQLSQVNSIPGLLTLLQNKAVFYHSWYLKDAVPEHLQAARQALDEANSAAEYQHQRLELPGSKYMLAAQTGKISEAGVVINRTLHALTDSIAYLHTAFDYAEKSKAYLLYAAMQDARALHFAGIADSLLEHERALRLAIAFGERQLQQLEAGGVAETDSAFAIPAARLFDLHRQHEVLKAQFSRDYPDYYRLRYDLSTVSVRQIQTELLQPGQTLLEFFVGDSALYAFVIGEDTYAVIDLKKDFPLDNWVSELRASLLENRSTSAATFCDLAYRLYQKLLAPVKPYLTPNLIIIPDGVLGYLPFEALLTEKPARPTRFSQHAYVLNDYRISYASSATLLREMMEKRGAAKTGSLAAFAPYYSGDTTQLSGLFTDADFRQDLKPLPFSGAEVAAIQKLLGGRAFYGKAATASQFLREASGSRVIHLATHGKANDRNGEYSFLAFSGATDSLKNELLYVRDLYNLNLQAELVTLSACETGIGKLQRGEGIIGLARAFTYAGARSLVTSLWGVNDEQTKDLMVQFYRNLKKGQTKDAALQSAKLRLARRTDGHPFFWAGFVAIGDMRALRP